MGNLGGLVFKALFLKSSAGLPQSPPLYKVYKSTEVQRDGFKVGSNRSESFLELYFWFCSSFEKDSYFGFLKALGCSLNDTKGYISNYITFHLLL